jgi:hypothetical protein
MFTLLTIVPLAKSIWDGMPMPIARGGPLASATSLMAASMPAMSASLPLRSVGWTTGSITSVPAMRAAATLVPPTSTPMTAGSLAVSPTAGKLRDLC